MTPHFQRVRVATLLVALCVVHLPQTNGCSCHIRTLQSNICAARSTLLVRAVAHYTTCRRPPCGGENSVHHHSHHNTQSTYIVTTHRLIGGPRSPAHVAPHVVRKGVTKRLRRRRPTRDDVHFLRTPFDTALCGATLHVGKIYLLALHARRHASASNCPSVVQPLSLCDGIYPWANVTRHDKDFVKRLAMKGTGCGHAACPGGEGQDGHSGSCEPDESDDEYEFGDGEDVNLSSVPV